MAEPCMDNPSLNAVPVSTVPANPFPAGAEPAGGDDCLDWDSEISNDGEELLILPEGDYLFRVAEFERARHGGSAKLPPCNKASLTLEIQTADGTARARTDLFLHRNTEWKVSSFFRAIGLKAKGEQVKMDWNRVTGAWGRAHIRPRRYAGSDGSEHQANEVVRFLDYDAALVQPGFLDVSGRVAVPF